MTTTLTPSFDQPDEPETRRFLDAYRPSDVAEDVWLRIAPDVVELVASAGTLTRLRVEKDIQCVGHVAAHLADRGRPVTLEEVLEDRTILSYDLLLQKRAVAAKTRENQRGILRRLQAVHRGLPWRRPRREDGERVAVMVQPVLLDELLRVEAVAHAAANSQGADAACFLQVLATSGAGHAGAEANTSLWHAARRFAERNGLHLTKPILKAALTYEVLQQPEPAAVLITRHRLTRRDLDLALALAQALPDTPSPAHRDVLRGPSPLR